MKERLEENVEYEVEEKMDNKKGIGRPSDKDIAEIIRLLEARGDRTELASLIYTDPWKILITTILSARSKDETTIAVSKDLFREYPDLRSLASADYKDIEDIIRIVGFYRNKARFIVDASKILKEEFESRVPNSMDALLRLPGVGRKVANCVLVYAYSIPAIPVDIHVHRIANRLGWVQTRNPEETETALIRLIPKRFWIVLNRELVLLGKSICTPQRPKHSICPIRNHCMTYKELQSNNKPKV